MKFTIRWQLFTTFLVVVLLTSAVVYGFGSRTLERFLLDETRETLLSEARLGRQLVMSRTWKGEANHQAIAEGIGRELRARVTLIAHDGRVMGDSKVGRAELATLENHLQRPEIQGALTVGSGSSIRYSATLQTRMMYVALPLGADSGKEGFIRLALPLSTIEKSMAHLRALLGIAVATALALAILVSALLSNVTSRRIRQMTTAAAHIGGGNYDARLPVTGHDEVAELGGVINDMAARIKGQLLRISSEKQQLDTILQGMGEGLMVCDPQGVITLSNPAFNALFSLRDGESGRHLMDISRQPTLHNALHQVIASRKELIEEITLPLPRETTLLTHWVPLLREGELWGVVAVFHDISELKKLERIRSDFVANVSHELRTPIAIIKGYGEALLEGVMEHDPVRGMHFVRIIHAHSDRLAHLVGDLLTLSQLESGSVPLERHPLSLANQTAHMFTLLSGQASQKGIIIRDEVPGDLFVDADPKKLEQVLVNLLDNAIKYTPNGGSIGITARLEGNLVELSITDSGVGIPDKDLQRIFERFYRVDAARSREMGGTGLGLAIVKHIVQLHGGTVSVTSTPGKGSTFTVTLPAAKAIS